jgi:hypothetical protein
LKKKANSIRIELLGNKIYAERPIYINRNSVVDDTAMQDSIYIPPAIVFVSDKIFNLYFDCFEYIFDNVDTAQTDFRGVKIAFRYPTFTESKSFYGQKNVDFIIQSLDNCETCRFDSTCASVINVIKKNRNFYYK